MTTRLPTIRRMLGSLAQFQRRLLAWYRAHRRDLPWRPAIGSDEPPDPYFVLVSEAMLQQTQVATVIPYFHRFIERFPTLQALANSDEQTVLRLWQGLGYYSRARNLRAAAQAIVERFGGHVPSEVDQLLTLPGIGRYTAGAVASIGFNQRAPIVDGNVIRVLARLDRIRSNPREDPAVLEGIWSRARDILPRRGCGDFNSALMELGATVCQPRTPRCLACPVRSHCEAAEAGEQEHIPPPRAARATPLHHRWLLCIQHRGRYLIEQRPASGRWAGLWQFITVESPGETVKPSLITAGALAGVRLRSIQPLMTIAHALTHRRYTFAAFHCQAAGARQAETQRERRWVSLEELDHYPLPRPHVKAAQALRRTAAIG